MLVVSRFSLARCNHKLVQRDRSLSRDELVERLRSHADPRGITAMFGGAVALTDTLVHHQDIRRALDHPRVVPAERVRAALQFAPRALALPAPSNMRGLRLVATDLDWSHGAGPEVRGPGEALLISIAGRHQGLTELSGRGLDLLRRRINPRGA